MSVFTLDWKLPAREILGKTDTNSNLNIFIVEIEKAKYKTPEEPAWNGIENQGIKRKVEILHLLMSGMD